MKIFKKRALFLFGLFIILFISSCTMPCMIEKKDYSCNGFKINGILNESENIVIKDIEHISEGLKIKGVLAEPKKDDKFPLILFNHWGKEDIKEWNWIEALAEHGYIVLASQYRGQGGSEGKIEIALGETTDALNLLECGKNLDNVDAENIGVMGFSHGGGITVQAMELTNDFKAGVEGWGATDIKKRFENIKSKDDPAYNWTTSVDKPKGKLKLLRDLLRRSAIYCVDKINAPLLIFHGKLDELMPYEYGVDLANALEKAGKEYEFIALENVGHEFERADGSKNLEVEAEVMKKTIEWFDKYLK